MLTLLQKILCAIEALGVKFLNGLITVVNLVIDGVGLFAGAIVGLLPVMPDPPAKPDNAILNAVTWLFPVGGIVAGCIVLLGLWTGYLVIRVALRWVKAL
jgi:hypothetical protein